MWQGESYHVVKVADCGLLGFFVNRRLVSLHCIALYFLHCRALQFIEFTVHYIALHCPTLHCGALQYGTVQ